MSKIVIAGGSGFLGIELAEYFKEKQYQIVILTRGASNKRNGINFVHWDATTLNDWTSELEDCEILINLTGKSVDCRYTEENKKEIVRSRVDATKILGEVIEGLSNPPKLWMNASTATIYRYSEDKMMSEDDGEIGDDFSMRVAKAWEKAFEAAQTPKTRKVALRISMVIGKSGGVYPVLRRLAKFGLAGKMGTGKQRFAWIHIEDLKDILNFIIGQDSVNGPVNCTSPITPTNKEFMAELRKSLRVPFGIAQPKLLLRIGAYIIGTESELILKSRWPSPKVLTDLGYKFKFTNVKDALENLSFK